jgi:hypothetical protein
MLALITTRSTSLERRHILNQFDSESRPALTFICRTGHHHPVKCNSLWMKGKTLPHAGAGMGI